MPSTKRKRTVVTQSTIEKKPKVTKKSTASNLEHVEVNRIYKLSFHENILKFWELCKKLNPKSPLDALSCLDLKLVGPFYYLQHPDKVDTSLPPAHYHMQWRYYYDVPEFLTLITSTRDGFHIGLLSDDPKLPDQSQLIVSNPGDSCKMTILADNLFTAIKNHVNGLLKRTDKSKKKEMNSIKAELEEILKSGIDRNVVSSRKKLVVTNCFHGAGVVVPIENECGYRPINLTNNELRAIGKRVEEARNDAERMDAFHDLEEEISLIQFANDECDFGMGLELGINLFCHGSKYFFKLSRMLLTTAYQLLGRQLYADIVEKHLTDRRNHDDGNLARFKP